MSTISVENLTFSYPGSDAPVFDHVSFNFDTSWKLGLVGRNGRGKTTLLKLLLGEFSFSGSIHGQTSFRYFPAPVEDPSQMTCDVLAEICPQAETWEFMREMSLLGCSEDALWQPFETLSGGEQTKALLAALFLDEDSYLLIDEPTNHLDLQARKQVSAYLNRKRGFLLVSHDRCFLDGCVDHILALNRCDFTIRQGRFSEWLEDFNRTQAAEEAKHQKLEKTVKRLRQSARKKAEWSRKAEAAKFGNGPADRGYLGHKSAKMMKRAKSVQNRLEKAAEEKSGLLKNQESADALKLSPLEYHADVLAICNEAAPVFDGVPVCKPLTFRLHRGSCVFLDGANGSGKSSLLKLIAGGDGGFSGEILRGSQLKCSVVPQNTSGLSGSLRKFIRDHHLDETLFKATLRKMDFERELFDQDMAGYSAGQKKKVWLAKSLCEPAHLYIWDEPLNYIDLFSRMQIEELISTYRPTMLIVEHDAAFREALADRVITLERFPGARRNSGSL